MTTDKNADTVHVEYHNERAIYYAEFDPDTILPSLAIVTAMAQITDEPPMDLPPLEESTTVHTDALDGLFKRDTDTQVPSSTSVTCPYLGYSVTVFKDGTMEIESSLV